MVGDVDDPVHVVEGAPVVVVVDGGRGHVPGAELHQDTERQAAVLYQSINQSIKKSINQSFNQAIN